MPAKFEVYSDASGQFRFRLRAANNKIIAVSEAYTSKAGCMNGIESVKTNAPIAEIEDSARGELVGGFSEEGIPSLKGPLIDLFLVLYVILEAIKHGRIDGLVKFMKLLYKVEEELTQKKIRGPSFVFYPWKYGPWSPGAKDDLDSLIEYDLVLDDEGQYLITPTPAADKLLKKSRDIIQKNRDIFDVINRVVKSTVHDKGWQQSARPPVIPDSISARAKILKRKKILSPVDEKGASKSFLIDDNWLDMVYLTMRAWAWTVEWEYGVPDEKTRNPIIIAHNCGYEGYGVECYSKEATKKACHDSDYLEIDLKLEKIKGKKTWWYFHDGITGGEGREKGISFDQFLNEFKDATRATKSKPNKTGLFLDLKGHLNQDEVNNLLDHLHDKYKRETIPKGTPLMVFTGRGFIPVLQTVYYDTTRYLLKWLSNENNKGKCLLNSDYCPKFTIVTREANLKKLVEGGGKASLDTKEIIWFWNNFFKKIWWGYNPYTAWLPKYFTNYLQKDYRLFEFNITLLPWFTKFLPWNIRIKQKFTRFLPWNINIRIKQKFTRFFFWNIFRERARVWEEDCEGIINIIIIILRNYWMYKTCYNGLFTIEESPGGRAVANDQISWSYPIQDASWGIITYKPNELKDFIKRLSFVDIESARTPSRLDELPEYFR